MKIYFKICLPMSQMQSSKSLHFNFTFFSKWHFKGHYLAGSRSTSLSHQKSTNCQIFTKFPQNTNSTLLILIQFKTDSYLLSLTSSDRCESSDLFFNHGPLILFSQTKTDLIRKPVQFWVVSSCWHQDVNEFIVNDRTFSDS